METAVGSSRLLARWRPRRLTDAATAATCLTAIGIDAVAPVDAWHLACLVVLVGVVALFRLQRPTPSRGVGGAFVTVIVAAQPTLHLVGEVWHRSTAVTDAGQGAAHLSLLGAHLALAAALFVVLVLTDMLVLALADAFRQILPLLAALRGAAPEDRVVRLRPTTRVRVADGSVWAPFARRRGPPRPLFVA